MLVARARAQGLELQEQRAAAGGPVVAGPRDGGVRGHVSKGSLTPVIVCHCLVVRDTDLRACAEAGARTVGDVLRATGAGSACGGCAIAVRQHAKTALCQAHGTRPDEDAAQRMTPEVVHAAG